MACKSALNLSLVYSLEQEKLDGISLGPIISHFSCWLGKKNYDVGWLGNDLPAWLGAGIDANVLLGVRNRYFFPSNKEK